MLICEKTCRECGQHTYVHGIKYNGEFVASWYQGQLVEVGEELFWTNIEGLTLWDCQHMSPWDLSQMIVDLKRNALTKG